MPHVPFSPSSLPVEPGEGFCLAICHDLRGPLATADAALDELARTMSCRPGEDSRRHLEIARRSLSKADQLITALPALLAQDPAPLRPLPVAVLVETVRDDLDLELERCGGVLRVVGDLPTILGDAARLRIALRNLVQNSIRHRRADAAPRIAVRAWLRSGWCTITVSDNGRGLAPAADGPRAGLGLGIAIARRAVEASGGRLSFAAHRGHGTTAALTVPAAGDRRRELDRSHGRRCSRSRSRGGCSRSRSRE